MNRLSDKTVLITGGTLGIGLATAELFASNGAVVFITGRNADTGAAAVGKLEDKGLKATFLPQDVCSEADWERVLAEISTSGNSLNILVNNAGMCEFKTIEDTSLEDWRAVMAVNLDGVFLGTKLAIAMMKESGGGSIVNISSIGGMIGTAVLPAYSASKAGVRLLSKCAALHCGEQGYGIRVNSLHPGFIETELSTGLLETLGGGSVDEGRTMMASKHPIGRVGTVSDAAEAILYLSSDESSFMTGSELVLDGGFTAQ